MHSGTEILKKSDQINDQLELFGLGAKHTGTKVMEFKIIENQ